MTLKQSCGTTGFAIFQRALDGPSTLATTTTQAIDAGAFDPWEFSPTRYYVDKGGRRVLIGLSAEETFEFEKLEQLPPLDDSGHVAWSLEGNPTTICEKRWLELYAQHDSAWETWAAQNVSN